jgi:hypothetical protein
MKFYQENNPYLNNPIKKIWNYRVHKMTKHPNMKNIMVTLPNLHPKKMKQINTKTQLKNFMATP